MLTLLKQIGSRITATISPKLFFQLAYLHNRGRLPNLKTPQDISEIWIKKILEGRIKDIFYLADKYLVRDFVKEQNLEYILTPLLAVYKNPNEIDFKKLPNRFALKMNFGAGMNLVCMDKQKFDINKAFVKLNKWINSSLKYSASEQHYNLINPRLIICEEFIDDGNGGFPNDYKFMCIKGHVYCVLACSHRETGHACYSPYNLEWNLLKDYDKGGKAVPVPCPANLREMVEIAELLSKKIDLVRVDLYSNGEKIWFGEMTLSPSGCIFHRWSQKALDEMGRFYHDNV